MKCVDFLFIHFYLSKLLPLLLRIPLRWSLNSNSIYIYMFFYVLLLYVTLFFSRKKMDWFIWWRYIHKNTQWIFRVAKNKLYLFPCCENAYSTRARVYFNDMHLAYIHTERRNGFSLCVREESKINWFFIEYTANPHTHFCTHTRVINIKKCAYIEERQNSEKRFFVLLFSSFHKIVSEEKLLCRMFISAQI